ncbi:AAA family ATPase [Nocardiopsis sp. NRRL B-16309]|uniref:AAA family ATPase n=1 Tax=Nocardiopsis sp. NRRL B-16309 TaxID=1519494 RepID=UPI0006AFF714|nr:AAA family ATPase [Nocardiopsis sp. NRRL B-16309]KOX22070.1 hypothetical protein ADL05_03260 [Nocardiopsis sp. NRRL B-16309]
MARRRLRSVTVEGLTSIRSATVELGDVNVLIGPNGAGKSNFVSALAMLGRIADGELGIFVGQSGGGAELFHKGPKGGRQIRLTARFSDLDYHVALSHGPNDRLVFDQEDANVPFDGIDEATAPVQLAPGSSESVLSSIASGEIRVSTPTRSALQPLIDTLHACRVFHFHDTSTSAPVKQSVYTADNITLRQDAGNLAAVLLRLRDTEPTTYRQILRGIQKVAPFLRDFVLVEQNERVQLRWKQVGGDDVFPASALSDGTLRFVCLATLLGMPGPPGLIVLDEPELGLHPFAIVQLASMLQAASTSSQIVIATQSSTLVDQFALDEVIVVERENGSSAFRRPDPEPLSVWLDDFSLGELWQKNLLGGRPRPERG